MANPKNAFRQCYAANPPFYLIPQKLELSTGNGFKENALRTR